MNNKKVKKLVGCVCALAMFLGSIPMNAMQAKAEETTTIYYDAAEENNALQLHGVTYDATEQIYKRMDLATAAEIAGVTDEVNAEEEDKKYSFLDGEGEFKNNVYSHAREAAGGRIRFSTASSYVSIKATLQNWDYTYAKSMEDGKYGFDVYVDTVDGSIYAGTVSVAEYPKANGEVTLEGTVDFGSAATRNITIYFPITIETKSVQIGVSSDCTIDAHGIPYEANKELVFYGSSITQGGAVSKPGNTYVNTVGRTLNMDYHSYGVWGSAKGQIGFAQYIAENHQDMTAFVFDYDHNNSTVLDLDGTKDPETKEWSTGEYYPFYETIRAVNDNIPIILVTRPNNNLDAQKAEAPSSYSTTAEMKAFIRAAYDKAKAAGDENIHFIDGETFFDYSKGYLADDVHPNDAGQARMAEVIGTVLERALAGEKNICIEPKTDCADEKLHEDFELAENETLNWTNNKANLVANYSGVVAMDGDSVYKLAYKRQVGKTPTNYIQYNQGILAGCTDIAVEMDTTLYKNTNLNKWPYLSIMFRDKTSTNPGTYETRVQLIDDGYKVTIVDNSDYNNDVKPTYSKTIKDDEIASLIQRGTEFSFHVRTEMNTVIVGNGTKQLAFTVSVDDKTTGLAFTPENPDCAPTGLRVYLYGGSNEDQTEEEYKALVDDIKMYKITKTDGFNSVHTITHVDEVPATTESAGVRAHYACSICGQKYLDADGLNIATEEDLVLHKYCSLLSEDFTVASGEKITDRWTFNTKNTVEGNDAFGVVTGEDGNSVYQLAYTRSDSITGTPTGYISSTTAMLENVSDYTIEMDGALYRGVDTGKTARWSALGLVLRDRETEGYYDIRFDVKKTGCQIQLYDETGTSRVTYGAVIVEDAELVEMYDNKGPMSFKTRVEVDNYVDNDGNKKIKLSIYVEDSDATAYNNVPVVYDITPAAECSPTSIRLFMHGGIKSGEINHLATVDNINIYTAEHTLSPVEKIASTDTLAGTKAHYACSKCDKTFLDNNGTHEVSSEDLAYARLVDIKCQTRPKKNGLTDVRFVAFVDDYTKYQSITFKITLTASGRYGEAECEEVYELIHADGTKYSTDGVYGVDGHFAAFKLLNNTRARLDEQMHVLVTMVDLDGNTRTLERTITISQEQQ